MAPSVASASGPFGYCQGHLSTNQTCYYSNWLNISNNGAYAVYNFSLRPCAAAINTNGSLTSPGESCGTKETAVYYGNAYARPRIRAQNVSNNSGTYKGNFYTP